MPERPSLSEDRWLPDRLAALGFLLEGERKIANEFIRVLDIWLKEVRGAALSGLGTRWVTVDPVAAQSAAPRWAALLAEFVERAVAWVVGRAYARVMGEGYAFTSRPWVAQHLEEVTNHLVRVPDEVFNVMRRELDTGINAGESIPELAERIDKELLSSGAERWQNRAITIARTETLSAYNGGTEDAFSVFEEAFGIELEKVWLASMDHRTRDTHFEADGQRVPKDGVFVVGGFPGLYPGAPELPAHERINCLTGDSRITAGRFVKGYRRRYEGEVYLVELDSGERFTASPNHPVLTPAGWGGAGNLQRGDYLVGGAVTDDRSARSPDVEGQPPTAAQLYDALAEAGHATRLAGLPVDFHGDGRDGDVEVVLADRELVVGLNTALGQQRYEAVLASPDLARLAARTALQPGLRATPPAHSGMSVGHLASAGGGLHGRPLDPLSLAPAPELNLGLGQAAQDHGATDAEVLGQGLDGHALQVQLHKVVHVERQSFHGFLYNFETTTGSYIGNGVINHNCRCTALYVEPGEETDMSGRGMRDPKGIQREIRARAERGVVRWRDQ